MSSLPRTLLAILLVVSDCAVAGTPMEDFDAAQQLAKREKKDLILSFSGYCWGESTIGFDTNTDDPWIRKHFVIFEVPVNSSALGEAAAPGDEDLVELRKWYHQDLDTPDATNFLLEASGRPYAKLSCEEQPAEAYIPELEAALLCRLKRDAAFEQAREAKGLKKARLLNKGLLAFDAGPVWSYGILVDYYYQDVLAEIIRNDPKDVLSIAEELEEKREQLKEKEIEDLIKTLAGDLNQMLDGDAQLASISAAIDQFLLGHPEFAALSRQKVLAGKIEAAVILRDYTAAQKALDQVVSAFPNSEGSKTLISEVRPEIERAQKLSAYGIEKAATTYAIRLDFYTPGWLDADGSRTKASLKNLDEPPPDVLADEPTMYKDMARIDLLLRLRNYERALKTLDLYTGGVGPVSAQEKQHDREFRPAILRGLKKKHPNEAAPPGEQR